MCVHASDVMYVRSLTCGQEWVSDGSGPWDDKNGRRTGGGRRRAFPLIWDPGGRHIAARRRGRVSERCWGPQCGPWRAPGSVLRRRGRGRARAARGRASRAPRSGGGMPHAGEWPHWRPRWRSGGGRAPDLAAPLWGAFWRRTCTSRGTFSSNPTTMTALDVPRDARHVIFISPVGRVPAWNPPPAAPAAVGCAPLVFT